MPTYGYLLPTRGSVLASDDGEALAARTQADVIDLARRAEALGFGSVWVGDSVLARPRHEPLSTLAAVGTVTDAVDLGTAVYLPALRKPVNVAHLTASVDQLTGGRLLIGVGASSGQSDIEAEHANLDVSFENRGAQLNELLEIVTRLWTTECVDYDGKYYQLDDASLGFGPVRVPPIYVSTGSYHPEKGFPKLIRERIVSHGTGCLPNVMSPERYGESLDHINELLEDAGRDPSTFDRAYYMDAVVDDDEETAVEEAREFYGRYYSDRREFTVEEIKRRGAFGPPSTVAETLGEYADAGAERVVVRFVTPNQRTSLRRFADLL